MRQRKRGFTVTELVIFIVVIAILAGSMITGFVVLSNEMKAAKREREANQAALQAKLDEISAKLNGTGGGLSWEDFENELASQLAKQEASWTEALNRALDEFAGKYAGGAGLTEAQVKAIMEEALAGQLTEAQVRNIVNNAVRGLDSAPSAAEISKIVRQALSSYMTAEQVEAFVDATISGQNEKIQQIVDEARENMQKEFKKLLDTYFESNQKEFDSDNVVFSFAAISDIHIMNSTTDAVAKKFESALKQLKAQALLDDADGLDAVFAVGDIIDTGYSGKYEQTNYFKTIYESVFSPTEVPMIYTPGNHDVKGWWTANSAAEAKNIDKLLGDNYFLTDIDAEALASAGNRHCVINGFHVITMLPTSQDPVTFTDSALQWFDETLAKVTAENPDQFVFVLTHPMIYDTVYGSDLGTYWYTKDLTEILNKYPQAVTFSGHLHFPLNDPRSIMQTGFTSLGCGSVRYMAIEAGQYEDMAGNTTMLDKDEFSQGLLVQIDGDGNMRITRMDFYHEEVIGEYWTVARPETDGSHLEKYSKDRGSEENNKAPVLSTLDVTLGATSGSAQAVSVSFAAGTDDEFVHHYQLVVSEKSGNVLSTYNILSDFYRHANTADMQTTWEKELSSLPKGGTYVVTLTAYDSWGAASNTLTKEFKTASNNPEDSKLPDAYVDFDFKDGTVIDTKGNVTIENKGATVGTAAVTAGTKSATVNALRVNNSGEYVLCTFNKLDTSDAVKEWAENGFSVEVFYVMGKKGGYQGVICGTEQANSTKLRGGWGIAENAGKPYFITASSKNAYDSANTTAAAASSTTELVHVVAVYDYAAGKQYLYINGICVNSDGQALSGEFAPAGAEAFNKFCLGADYKEIAKATSTSAVDFPTSDMTMVDAKIYSGALNAEQVTTAYGEALALLDESTPVTPTAPEAYVDFDFSNGTITDTKGNVTIENKGATVGTAAVTAGTKSATVNALRVSNSGEYVLCTFNKLDTSDAVKEWAENGFTVEAFYVMGTKGGVQGVVCGTEQANSTKLRGGWGIAENAGKPYFITASSRNAYDSANTTAAAASSTTELVHVVAVYDYAAGKQYLYINGECVNPDGQALSGEFAPAGAEAFNKFCLGADYRETAKVTSTTPIDYPTKDMTMVDAKIYSSALTAEQVQTAYENALDSLN
ncbi:MAG: metallophosphoesterase [Clostridiales bacterium]|nr:metallophosphoesterase [Clostridiales bacterium]